MTTTQGKRQLSFSYSCTLACETRNPHMTYGYKADMYKFSSYAPCLDATTYVFASEIWPTHLRAKGCAISTSGLYVGSLIVLTAAPTAFSVIGWKYYLCFLAATVCSIVLFKFYFVEVSSFQFNCVFLDDCLTLFCRPRDYRWRKWHSDLVTKFGTNQNQLSSVQRRQK